MVLVAKDIVEKDFLSLSRNTSALEAARQLNTKSHGFVIIASGGGLPAGIVTEWAPLALVLCGPDCLDEVLVPTCYLHVGALDISHVRYELFEILRELSLFLRSMKEPLEPSKLCGELVSPVLFPQNALE